METLYGLKRKTTNRWLKLLLLLFVAVGFGVPNLNAQTKSIKVANDEQLIEAMGNPAIGVIELVPGYYVYLDIQAEPGTTITKGVNGDGNRAGGVCTYFIEDGNFCFFPNYAPNPLDPIIPAGYSPGVASAGTAIDFCDPPGSDCCPPYESGYWEVSPDANALPSLTANVLFFGPSGQYVNKRFAVNEPGRYLLRYVWPATNSYAQTEYFFYGPAILQFEAPDVCGYTTTVDFVYDSGYYYPGYPPGDVQWFLDGVPWVDGPLETGETEITVEVCGEHELSVVTTFLQTPADPNADPPIEAAYCSDTLTRIVNFFCEPIADAGPDMYVCDDFCFTIYGKTNVPFNNPNFIPPTRRAANFSINWDYLPPNGLLTILPEHDSTVQVCRDETECSYGEYEVIMSVVNGLCDDADTMNAIFYEQPVADAGNDTALCNTFCFSLAAVPYEYCGEPGVNYWSHSWWTLEQQPGECLVDFNEFDPTSNVCITGCGQSCGFGQYIFRWHELNVKIVDGDTLWGESHCYASDDVIVTIYEDPAPSAGPDVAYCETEIGGDGIFMFALNGTLDTACYQSTVTQYHWELVSQPDACDIEITTGIDPNVYIRDCAPCQYGEYVFRLTQTNGYFIPDTQEFVEVCSTSDDVTIRIFETPENVDAGPDMEFCDTFAFTLYGIGDTPCYTNTVVIYSWEKSKEPGNCTVTFNEADDIQPGVVISDCDDACQYGEYMFKLTQSNGYYDVAGQFVAVCEETDSVSVIIYEQPEADAGDDYHACVDIAASPYDLQMNGSFDYCYTMYGVWAKSCGPGEVVFDDLYSSTTPATFFEPGRYIFTWTEWNAECTDVDTVLFDLIEQPTASAEDAHLLSECDYTCIDLGLAGVSKYHYFGTDQGECPNFWDNGHWSYISGPAGVPAEVSFADDTDPATDLCVSTFGCYTVRWNEVNKPDDKDYFCSAYVDVFIQFVETPEAFAGDDATLCGMCYTMAAVPFIPDNNNCPPAVSESFWTYIGYIPPDTVCGDWKDGRYHEACYELSDIYDPNAQLCICEDDYYGTHYGSYGFSWTEINGPCMDKDTVWITFNKIPDPVPLSGCIADANCSGMFNKQSRGFETCGCVDCWYPEDGVFTVCANTCGYLQIDWACLGFPPIKGYTYEWSFTGPAGSSFYAEPYYYDCECGWKGSDQVYLCFGECCDTARLYLTITSPEGCVTTEEWKFYVQHPPDATIIGPEVAEVGGIYYYSIPEPQNPCYLYTWEVEHCGEIVSGQGTGTIGVHWTDYNINGGWGLITVGVYDTCTCCCSTDTLAVKVYPPNTLGDATLSGHVYYQNNQLTPLNGVEIQLWNGGIPVQDTASFNDINGGNGLGYYKFTGIHPTTPFGITATYAAGNWYGANATDALAVELEVINALPGGIAWFVNQPLQEEAMDVNNNLAITATDALWIKQRAISMVTYFPAGNWVWNPGMSSSAGTYDIYTLNAGDANRSNIPASMKAAPAIALVNDGTMNVVTGQEFELPIRIAEANQFGAITLILGYNPALIEVVNVLPMDGMVSNISDGSVNIAWSNLKTMVLAGNDVVFTLKVKAISQFTAAESLFSIGLESEFADAVANTIEPVTLKTFGITTENAPADYFLSTNRPNPFSNSTFIEYTMPETGKVKLSVLDMLGQEIAVLVNATQSAGSYTVEFSAAGLSTGVYIYKITVDGETRDFISTQRMVISQ